MLRMYNSYKSNPKVEERVLRAELQKWQEVRKLRENFTIKRLLECRQIFANYIDKYGAEPPVHTRFSFLNNVCNNALKYTHFVHTNQEYAKKLRDSIDESMRDEKLEMEAEVVLATLVKFKEIHVTMLKSNISPTSKTRIAVEMALKKFEMSLDDEYFEKQKLAKLETIEYSKEVNSQERLYSPILERLFFK